MPFTPFHFGPGALIKAAAPGHFSFTVFAFAQVLIDCEVLWFWIVHGEPRHPYLHTFAGATLVAALSYAPGRRVCEWGLKIWNARLNAAQARWLAFGPANSRRSALWGAVIGAYSHVVLDSVMHFDMLPFAPVSAARPLYALLSIDHLHFLCMVAAAIGCGVVGTLRMLKRL